MQLYHQHNKTNKLTYIVLNGHLTLSYSLQPCYMAPAIILCMHLLFMFVYCMQLCLCNYPWHTHTHGNSGNGGNTEMVDTAETGWQKINGGRGRMTVAVNPVHIGYYSQLQTIELHCVIRLPLIAASRR